MSNTNYPIQTYIQPGINQQPSGMYEQPVYTPIGNDFGQPVFHPRKFIVLLIVFLIIY